MALLKCQLHVFGHGSKRKTPKRPAAFGHSEDSLKQFRMFVTDNRQPSFVSRLFGLGQGSISREELGGVLQSLDESLGGTLKRSGGYEHSRPTPKKIFIIYWILQEN